MRDLPRHRFDGWLLLLLVRVGLSGCGSHGDTQGNDPDAGPDAAPDATPCTTAACRCEDGVKDDQETDVDCGGGTCHKCAAGHDCTSASDCITGTCSTTTMTCSVAKVSFADAVSYPASFKPYVMLSGDLDGDGHIDLAAANEEANTITMLRNVGDGTGTFMQVPATTRDGFPTGEYPTGGAIADLDRDGVLDVITADYHGNSVSVLLGAGSGPMYTLQAPASYPTVAGAETSNLAVGDLNGDGILDVIATNPQASSISVFLGRGNGTLAPATTVPCGMPGMSEPYSVAIGDFDGDGKNDAAIADNASGTVFIKLGNGDGTFHPGPSQPQIMGVASFILLARDLDLDGKLDLVVANRSSDNVSVLLGRGNGDFRPAIVSSTGTDTGPYSIAVADFNLDGVPDVVTADYKSSSGSVLLGNGDGSFAPSINAGNTGMYSYGVATGDFNGDGRPDFATANAVSDDVTVKLSLAQ